MSIETYITYLLATTLVLVVPGPTVILVISQALTNGKRSVIPLVAGVVAGDLVCMTCSVFGVGALLLTSASLFKLLKWIGVLYLFYLGATMIFSDSNGPADRAAPQTSVPPMMLFRRSFLVTALNPKGIGFFVAFLPQFINPAQGVPGQFILLGATFLFLAMANATVYALFAGQLREQFKKREVHRVFRHIGGTTLIGAGIVTAVLSDQ